MPLQTRASAHRGDACATRLPMQLTRRDCLVDPFQLEGTEFLEGVSTARANEGSKDVGCENFSSVGALAQPLGDHDRGAEVIVFFFRDLADVHTDAEA